MSIGRTEGLFVGPSLYAITVDVLFVGSDSNDDVLIKKVLENKGYNVCAKTLKDARELLTKNYYHAIVIDPDYSRRNDQNSLIRLMNNIATQNIPVVLASIEEEEVLQQRHGIVKGGDYHTYLKKPYSPDLHKKIVSAMFSITHP